MANRLVVQPQEAGIFTTLIACRAPGSGSSTDLMSSENDPPDLALPEDRPVPVPEDYLGTTMMINGVGYRLDAIEAIGSKFVVFRARNTATNTVDLVAKMPRSDFDPRQPLLEALPIALKDLDQNPDRVIRICERLLKLDPTMEAAAFNLGIACYQKKDIASALDAFERALALAAQDGWNLLHRASCLALLGRDEECLHDFRKAAEVMEVESDGVHGALGHIRGHALNIQTALGRLSRRGPTGNSAMQALDDYF
jgi:tetratricopeptide (TPR) repeat protein